MLKIRQAGFDKLAAAAEARFALRLADALAALMPEAWARCGTRKAAGTPAPAEAVKQLLQRGRALGLVSLPALAGFAALYFVNLQVRRPGEAAFVAWAMPLLENTELDDDERLAVVQQGLAWRGKRDADAAWAQQRLAAVMEVFA